MRAPSWWEKRSVLSTALLPLAALYARAGERQRRRAKPIQANVPVLCVGNLIAGGAGKTPAALAIAALAQRLGWTPHFLTRGYGGRLAGPVLVDPTRHGFLDVGDEALLLARAAPAWLSHNRAEGASAAAKAGADLVIMDDGLQNPSLVYKTTVLVIDGAYGFGNGRVLPAGPLRETLQAARSRLDIAIIIGPDRHHLTAALAPLPILKARLESVGTMQFIGQKILPFAGIGRPQKFFDTLLALGCEVCEPASFADHHPYRTQEIQRLKERASRISAELVTTEKDWVRIPASEKAEVGVLPVHLVWEDDAEALMVNLLSAILPSR